MDRGVERAAVVCSFVVLTSLSIVCRRTVEIESALLLSRDRGSLQTCKQVLSCRLIDRPKLTIALEAHPTTPTTSHPLADCRSGVAAAMRRAN